jgi:hypothetical protein
VKQYKSYQLKIAQIAAPISTGLLEGFQVIFQDKIEKVTGKVDEITIERKDVKITNVTLTNSDDKSESGSQKSESKSNSPT